VGIGGLKEELEMKNREMRKGEEMLNIECSMLNVEVKKENPKQYT
jgi:hypothetical protein